MSASQMLDLLPLIIVGAVSLLVLILWAFLRRPTVSFALTAAGLVASLVDLGFVWPQAPVQFAGLLTFDRFTLVGIGLLLAATLFVAIISWAYLRGEKDEGGEYYFLLLLATLGACVLAASESFVTLFLGLELLSVSLFTLIAWKRDRATEAGIKYLILAGTSSAFLLFGMALIYAALGSFSLDNLAVASDPTQSLIAAVGLGMMVVGIGFKLAVVPFHLWTPDVYDGAPAPVTGYIATVSKGAMALLLVRLFGPALAAAAQAGKPPSGAFGLVVALIAGLSMFIGNLLALREDNVKRILAYSSIAHLGYVLVAFLVGGGEAMRAVLFYLVAYFVTSLAAFAAVSALSTRDHEADTIDDYRGIGAKRPLVAVSLTAALLSLAGLPLTAGFIGKFIILSASAGAQLWALAVILVVNSTISLFYYLRIISALFRAAGEETHTPAPALPLAAGAAIAVLALIVVVLGVYPTPLLDFIGTFTTSGF